MNGQASEPIPLMWLCIILIYILGYRFDLNGQTRRHIPWIILNLIGQTIFWTTRSDHMGVCMNPLDMAPSKVVCVCLSLSLSF